MLDSLLYEPKRRRIAMATLFVLLVLAVGFIAIGTWVESAAALHVFGVAFLAASIAFLGKLLVVSHVHIRGTAGRLEAMNDRYDDTSRWLERFDADTRESFLVTKRRLNESDAGRVEIKDRIEKLAAATPWLPAINELAERVEAQTTTLKDRSDEMESAIDSELKGLRASQAEASEKMNQRIKNDRESLASQIGTIGDELKELASLAERVETLEGEIQRFDAVQAELERIDTESVKHAEQSAAEQADAARASSADELAKARAELDDKLRLLNGRVSKVNAEQERKRQSAVHAVREEAGESVAKLQKRLDHAAQLNARQRGDGYVQFSRVLSQDAIEAASSFGGKAAPGHLKYLERKLQVIEGLCEGRLAGSVDDAIGRALAGHMIKAKELRILEIGVLFGIGAAFMHHALSPRHERVRLSLLDPFQGYYGSDHLDPLTGLPVTRAAVERNMARCGIAPDDVEILEGFSHEESIREAAEQAGPYHIIVIDGDHSAEGVRADYEGYAGMLRAGGLLVIDDYGSEDWPAVTAYVDETVRSDPRFKPVAVIGKTVVFKRARSAGGKKAANRTTPRATTGSTSSKADAATGSAKGKALKQPATKPGQSEGRSEDGDPPVPVVTTQRRTKQASKSASKSASKQAPKRASKKASKKAAKKTAVPAGSGETDDADS